MLFVSNLRVHDNDAAADSAYEGEDYEGSPIVLGCRWSYVRRRLLKADHVIVPKAQMRLSLSVNGDRVILELESKRGVGFTVGEIVERVVKLYRGFGECHDLALHSLKYNIETGMYELGCDS
jgi:hypothetical protein